MMVNAISAVLHFTPEETRQLAAQREEKEAASGLLGFLWHRPGRSAKAVEPRPPLPPVAAQARSAQPAGGGAPQVAIDIVPSPNAGHPPRHEGAFAMTPCVVPQSQSRSRSSGRSNSRSVSPVVTSAMPPQPPSARSSLLEPDSPKLD